MSAQHTPGPWIVGHGMISGRWYVARGAGIDYEVLRNPRTGRGGWFKSKEKAQAACDKANGSAPAIAKATGSAA